MASAGDALRYVATRAIRTALRGREGEVLDALGIAWRNGRPHISCPYPQHDDRDPSWRWDEGRALAMCTCIEKSDSIFDVVSKIVGGDFKAAKLRVAELLGRTDLIKSNSDGAGQKTDAASLLNPPAGYRDDSLARRYFAGRLGLGDSDFIPGSTTRTVGWKALAYYDAAAKKGGKPKLIASLPCAVFETIAADGRHHAHRVYLNPTGDGKAELGTLANGKQRDPKKSARRPEGAPSTAGCCVVWGEVETALKAILAEGVETAVAIAYCFANEIAKGEITVLSAVTAGGIEAFVPWLATKTLTVAADRDEAKPGAGFKRGERSARKLALRLLHQERRALDLRLALPGAPGTGTDFLDLLLTDRVDAVRAAILGAGPLVPTKQEIEEFEGKAALKGEIDKLAKALPLPPLIGLRLAYRRTEDNRIWLHKFCGIHEDKDTEERFEIWEPVCSPLGGLVLLSTTGPRLVYGLRIHVQNFAGAINTIDFLRSELPKLGAAGIRSELMAGGVRVANGGELTIVEILKQAEPDSAIRIGGALGWQDDAFLVLQGDRQW